MERVPMWTAALGLAVSLIVSAPGRAVAQTAANSGEVVGTIVDSSGAALAGAVVTVRSRETNLERRATTDNAGRYAVPALPLGTYGVDVTAPGLEPAEQTVRITLGGSA